MARSVQIRLGETEHDHRPHLYKRTKLTKKYVTLECWLCNQVVKLCCYHRWPVLR